MVPVFGAKHMVPKQLNHDAAGGSQWRSGLNYASTHYVSEGAHAELNQLRLKHRQSDVYAEVFGTGAGAESVRRNIADAHARLRNVLGDKHSQLRLDKRYEQLGKAATEAGVIRDKLDTVWSWGDWVKYLIPKGTTAFMLAETAGAISIRFGTIPKPLSGGARPLNYGFTLSTSTVQNLQWALGISWGMSAGLKKLYDRWQPKYFTGIADNRKDMALLAKAFRENSQEGKEARAGGAATAALMQAYGENGRDFLESLMDEVDRSAYAYMQALQRSTPKPMPADEHLVATGATSASAQLTYARLEEARFINTFTGRAEGGQAVVKYWQPSPVFADAGVLLRAKDPHSEKEGQSSSSQTRRDERAGAGFALPERWDYSRSLWDYSPSLSKTLEHLERKASEVSGGMANWKQIKSDLSAAKKKDDSDAMFRLAELCEKGIFGIPGTDAARTAGQLYSPAANKGNVEAQYRLGRILADACFTGQAELRNERAAAGWLALAAKQGHAGAQYRLGSFHADERLTGREEFRNDPIAVEWLTLAAQQGHAQAQAELGMMHAAGRTGLDAHETAMHARLWCESALKAGARSPELLFTIARLYREGRVLGNTDEEHDALVAKWHVEAAEEGHVVAQRELGLLHLEGAAGLTGWGDGAWETTTKKGANDVDAARYLRMAAEQNDPEALYHLGKMYLEERASAKGATDKEAAAADCFKRAADGGLAQAQCELARMYMEGLARPGDAMAPHQAAAAQYEQAAAKGSFVALMALADLHEAGQGGIAPGPAANQKIAECLTRAAGHPEADPSIAYRLAELYARGMPGLPAGSQGLELAAEWYAKAAAKKFKDARHKLARTQYKLAYRHLKGLAGLPKGPEADDKAIELLTRIAEAGNAEVQFELAGLYASGRGTVPSGLAHKRMAAQWCEKAAKNGHPQACYELGRMYEQGRTGPGEERAIAKAVELYRAAAGKGIAAAQYRLGELYRTGRATLEGADEQGTREEAKRLFAQASEQGHMHARFQYGRMLLEDATESADAAKQQDAAVLLIESATATRDPALQHELGVLYHESKASTEASQRMFDKAALKWLKKAANQGHVPSMRMLGYIHELGRGGLESKDAGRREAVKYYKQAEDKGDEYALSRLAALTEAGYTDVKEDEGGEEPDQKAVEL